VVALLTVAVFNLLADRGWGAPAIPKAKDGYLDLRDWTFTDDQTLSLKGSWEFYWQKLLQPQDFRDASSIDDLPSQSIGVPGPWTSGTDFPARGYGTYRLRIHLSHVQPLTMQLRRIWSASRIFVDGQEIVSYGQVGPSRSEYEPETEEFFFNFTPLQKEFDIVIQVSSFEFFLAGLTYSPELGSRQAILNHHDKILSISFFLIGSIIIMGIYHLALFALRTQDRSTLYFALFCLFLASYLSVTAGTPIEVFYTDLGMDMQLKLFNLGWIPAVAFFAFFVRNVFPDYLSRWVTRASAVVAGSFSIIVLVTKPNIYVDVTLGYQYWTGALLCYTLYKITKAYLHRVDGAGIFLIGLMIMFSATLHDMLMTLGIFESYPMAAPGLFIFIFFQSYLIAARFSKAFKRVAISEKKIRKLSDELRVERDQVVALNENLEDMVEEKTRDIRSMMTHVQIGIFAITADNLIHKDYSNHLREIFEKDDLAGANACDILFADSDMSSDEESQARSAIDICLGEDEFIFEVNLHCLPMELKRKRHSDGQIRILELTWNPIADDTGTLEKLLVTVRDATDLRQLQEQAAERQEELQFIGELIDIPAASFQRFIQTCHDFINENRKLINSKSIELKSIEALKVLFINMHTMKGAARSLYLKRMTHIFHDVEQYYATLQNSPDAEWNIAKMNDDLNEVESILQTYESINQTKLGRKTTDDTEVEFPESQVADLYNKIRFLSTEDSQTVDITMRELRSVLFPKLFTPAKDIFEDIFQCTKALAKDLEKAQPQVSIEGDRIYFNHQAEDLMRKVFVHVVRNSMDHGIEKPRERIRRGKTEEGHLHLRIRQTESSIVLEYWDDGNGLNIEKIKEIGKARGLITADQNLTLNEAAELIFHSGLSTANEVNDISGRGVGMDAVRNYLRGAKADLEITFADTGSPHNGCYPFKFLISLPLEFCATESERVLIQAA
jgi:HPt (histidine-containing phosphotransfer) domain-containing protein